MHIIHVKFFQIKFHQIMSKRCKNNRHVKLISAPSIAVHDTPANI